MEVKVVLLIIYQKFEKASKNPKNLKDMKSCKDYWFGETLNKTPILRQLDIKNSSFY